MQTSGIDHVVLRVRDMARMIDFYSRVLGCEVVHRQEKFGLVHLRAGTSLIDLVDVAGPIGTRAGAAPAGPAAHNMDHLCLRVREFDAASIRRELEAEGIEVGEIAERYGSTGRAPSVYLRDPEGNGLELRPEVQSGVQPGPA
jgi:catechol 2,3-dioxygenase-like lactoylglutathione lyase family enzyme